MAERGWINKRIDAAIDNIVNLAIGAVSFAAIIALGVGFLHGFGNLCHWLQQPVSVTRWHYWILVAIAGSVAVIALAAALLRNVETPQETGANFRDYVQDTFFGIVWRWRWVGDQINLSSIRIYCPRCDMALPWGEFSYGLTSQIYCDNCGPITEIPGDQGTVIDKALRKIDLKIRDGSWKQLVAEKA